MTWYAAHAIMSIRFLDGEQDYIPVWENVFLVSAESVDEAYAKAEARGRCDEGDADGSLRWKGATWDYSGIRKLTECVDADCPPADLTEVTYSEMSVRTRQELEQLVAGKEIIVSLGAVNTTPDDRDKTAH